MEKDYENGFRPKPLNTASNSKWETIQKTIYNPSSKEICGRTPKSWGQLMLFYTIFYIVLAILFAGCMEVWMSSINDKEPKWILEESLIGVNPGLGFRPISEKSEDGALIWYNSQDQNSSRKWIELMDDFFKPYQNPKDYRTCNFTNNENITEAESELPCLVNIDDFEECNSANSYGYLTDSPCVFIKLNRIFGWKPDTYRDYLPEMPEDLKKAIYQTEVAERDQIWISCQPEGPADHELVDDFIFYPSHGIPGYYYPFKNAKSYLSPIIAVKIINPTPNILISIECRAWAKNIKYVGGNLNREGSVHFEIMVDNVTNPVV